LLVAPIGFPTFCRFNIDQSLCLWAELYLNNIDS
jgi:hypothetical protein